MRLYKDPDKYAAFKVSLRVSQDSPNSDIDFHLLGENGHSILLAWISPNDDGSKVSLYNCSDAKKACEDSNMIWPFKTDEFFVE